MRPPLGPQRLVARWRYGLVAPGQAGVYIPPPVPGLPQQAKPIVLPALFGAPAPEIRKRVDATKVMFDMDDSGSMYGTFGDPTGIRYAAALSLAGLMRRAAGGRAGVIHWGTTVGEVLSPVDVAKQWRALNRALRVPETLGGNDLPAALQRAVQELLPVGAEEQPLVFIITDGIEEVTAATHAAVSALPAGCVHMLLVDRSPGCSPAMEADWKTVAFGSFTRLTHLDVKAMANELGQVFAAALGLTLAVAAAPSA